MRLTGRETILSSCTAARCGGLENWSYEGARRSCERYAMQRKKCSWRMGAGVEAVNEVEEVESTST